MSFPLQYGTPTSQAPVAGQNPTDGNPTTSGTNVNYYNVPYGYQTLTPSHSHPTNSLAPLTSNQQQLAAPDSMTYMSANHNQTDTLTSSSSHSSGKS